MLKLAPKCNHNASIFNCHYRPDLCAGYVQLIIDGDLNQQVRLYLDAKPQRVDIDGKPHVLRFADRLKTLLINGHPFKVRFKLNAY